MSADRLRAYLIDDEPLALKRLARMLEATGRVEIVGRATDPAEGLREVIARPVDVLFLDIHMPGLSGFEVVERVPPGPAVVFTTAHDRHALRRRHVVARRKIHRRPVVAEERAQRFVGIGDGETAAHCRISYSLNGFRPCDTVPSA